MGKTIYRWFNESLQVRYIRIYPGSMLKSRDVIEKPAVCLRVELYGCALHKGKLWYLFLKIHILIFICTKLYHYKHHLNFQCLFLVIVLSMISCRLWPGCLLRSWPFLTYKNLLSFGILEWLGIQFEKRGMYHEWEFENFEAWSFCSMKVASN